MSFYLTESVQDTTSKARCVDALPTPHTLTLCTSVRTAALMKKMNAPPDILKMAEIMETDRLAVSVRRLRSRISLDVSG